MKPIMISIAFGFALVTPAFAHLGHLGEVAGHAHWAGVAAIAAAAALAALAGKIKKKDTEEAAPEDVADEAPEGEVA